MVTTAQTNSNGFRCFKVFKAVAKHSKSMDATRINNTQHTIPYTRHTTDNHKICNSAAEVDEVTVSRLGFACIFTCFSSSGGQDLYICTLFSWPGGRDPCIFLCDPRALEGTFCCYTWYSCSLGGNIYAFVRDSRAQEGTFRSYIYIYMALPLTFVR